MNETRSVYITDLGVPKTGLTPTWNVLKKVASGADVTPQPSITAVGGGWYKFDANVPVDEQWAGIIDAGATVASASERYIPVLLIDSDLTVATTVYITPVYDENSDTVFFMVFLMRNGELYTTPTSVTITVYDTTHTLLFTLNTSSSTNGVFVISKNTPGFTSGEGYYCKAELIALTKTFTSMETIISLD